MSLKTNKKVLRAKTPLELMKASLVSLLDNDMPLDQKQPVFEARLKEYAKLMTLHLQNENVELRKKLENHA